MPERSRAEREEQAATRLFDTRASAVGCWSCRITPARPLVQMPRPGALRIVALRRPQLSAMPCVPAAAPCEAACLRDLSG
jgi:hypothetical protein